MSKFGDEQDADTIAEFIDWFVDQSIDVNMFVFKGEPEKIIEQFLQYRRERREAEFRIIK